MNNTHPSKPDADPAVPERLREAFRRVEPPRLFVPPAVDHRILALARERLAVPAPWWAAFRFPVAWPAAAAAAALVALGLWFSHGLRDTSPPARPAFAREDTNHDGRVDILDALSLARQVEAGKPVDSRWDLNGDGVVNQLDALVIAKRSVQLSTEPGS